MRCEQKHLVLGVGEIGSAYYKLLSPHYRVFRKDIDPARSDKKFPRSVDVIHICLRYGDEFHTIVRQALDRFKPGLINVMTTTPPGTCETIDPYAVHSTTRGLHPSLDQFIRHTAKHYGGPRAAEVAELFNGIIYPPPILHPFAKTTELCHIASNTQYAASILYADELEKLFRHYGVDWFDFERYSASHNDGFAAMGYSSKFRPVLHPSGGRLGGHCIAPNARLVPKELRGPIMSRIAGD